MSTNGRRLSREIVIFPVFSIFAHLRTRHRVAAWRDGSEYRDHTQKGEKRAEVPLIFTDQNVAARCIATRPPRPMLAYERVIAPCIRVET